MSYKRIYGIDRRKLADVVESSCSDNNTQHVSTM